MTTKMAFDVDGNLYFTDRDNHTVRMIAADSNNRRVRRYSLVLVCPHVAWRGR